MALTHPRRPRGRGVRAAVAVVVAVALSACAHQVPGTGSSTGPTPTADAVVQQYRPAESTVVFSPQPDGAVVIDQTTVVDAGDGQGERPLTVFLPRQLRVTGTDRDASPQGWWFVTPAVSGATARETTDGDTPLGVSVGQDDDLLRISVTRTGGWPAGRHRVELRYTVAGLWTSIGDRPLLVLPDGVLGAGWYAAEQRSAAAFRVQGGAELQCAGDNPTSTSRPCDRQGGAVRTADADGGGSSSADNTYYSLTDPPGVTATPTPAGFEERR